MFFKQSFQKYKDTHAIYILNIFQNLFNTDYLFLN